jgi:DNA-binding FadR family transcriptional regulator
MSSADSYGLAPFTTPHEQEAAERFRSMSVETLPRLVGRALAASILLGDYEPGSPLPSAGNFATKFGVSIPVVREALKILAALGMVESRQGRVSRVAPRSSWNDLNPELVSVRLEVGVIGDIMSESLELRRVIEVEAAGLASERATEADLAAMRDRLDRLAGLAHDPAAYMEGDVAFHDTILEATHNRLLLQLIEHMRQLLVVARGVSYSSTSDSFAISREGHEVLYEAIASRDPDAARRAMTDHLGWAERVNVEAYLAANRSSIEGSPRTRSPAGRPAPVAGLDIGRPQTR